MLYLDAQFLAASQCGFPVGDYCPGRVGDLQLDVCLLRRRLRRDDGVRDFKLVAAKRWGGEWGGHNESRDLNTKNDARKVEGCRV